MNHPTRAAVAAHRELHIPTRFEGWPGIANGGYLAGLMYRALGGTVEVTLRRPTPVDAPLWLSTSDAEAALADPAGPLVSARRVEASIEPPAPVELDRAIVARHAYGGFGEVPFPSCFVCGRERSPADALRIFAGPVAPGHVAAPWVPPPSFEGDDGAVATEYVVAALDCPGAWAIASVNQRLAVPMVLGRATIRCLAPVAVARPHVVVGAATGEDGRKRFSTTAVYDLDGHLCAVADSIWFPASPRS